MIFTDQDNHNKKKGQKDIIWLCVELLYCEKQIHEKELIECLR